MGLASFFLSIICAILFIAIVPFVAWQILKRLIKNSLLSKLLVLPIVLLSAVLIWLYVNGDNLSRQHAMNEVSKDCGWTVYKTVRDVDGIYIEYSSIDPQKIPRHFRNTDLWNRQYYPAYEMLFQGKMQLTINDVPNPKAQETDLKRKFKYGYSIKDEYLESDIIRTTVILKDFDSGEVLARNISYTFDDSVKPYLPMTALIFPEWNIFLKECGANDRENNSRYLDVLVPLKENAGIDRAHADSAAQDVNLEILEDKKFEPEIIISKKDWDNEKIFASNWEPCKNITNIDFSQADHICHADAIWTGDYCYKTEDCKHYTLIKYSRSGDLQYKVRFEKPAEKLNYTGILKEETFKSENGFVTFDWESQMVNSPSDSLHEVMHTNRRLKVRIKEPSKVNP